MHLRSSAMSCVVSWRLQPPASVPCFILNGFNCCVNTGTQTHTHALAHREPRTPTQRERLQAGGCQTAERLNACFKTCLPAKLMSFAITQQQERLRTLFAVVSLTAGAAVLGPKAAKEAEVITND